MALTTAQTTAIRQYLGYANLNRYLNTALEGTFTALDADGTAAVVSILTELTAVDAVLAAAGLVISAQGTLKAVDEIQFYDTTTGVKNGSGALARGRMLVTRLSTLLGVPVYADYFGQNGYPGDPFSDVVGMGGYGQGGLFRLG